MPRYDYRCPHCSGVTTLRRSIDEMDAPAESLCCGAAMERVFTPTNNLFVPIAFQAKYGATTWSDVHDVTERQLAHVEGVEPMNRAMSQPGAGLSGQSIREKRAEEVGARVDAAYKEARLMAAAEG